MEPEKNDPAQQGKNVGSSNVGLGRPLGSPNRITAAGRAEAKQFCLRIVRDPRYAASFAERAFSGTLPAAVEVTMLHYAWGKPVEHIEVGLPQSSVDLSELSDEQLAERAGMIADVLRAKAAADRAAVEAAELAAAQDAHDLEREKHAVESVIMKQMGEARREAVH